MNPSLFWVILGASNPACLFLGFLLGRIARATVRLEESVADKEVSNSPPLRKRVTATHLVAVGVVLIGIVTAVMGFVVTRNQDRLAGCVAGYSNALADTLERRAAPQQEATDQLDAVMQAIVKAYQGVPGAGSESVRQAILDYVAAREHVKQTLKDNPLPDAPRDACRELLE